MPRREYFFDDDEDEEDDSQQTEPISRLAAYGAVRMYLETIRAMQAMRPHLRDAAMTSVAAKKALAILNGLLDRHDRDLERSK